MADPQVASGERESSRGTEPVGSIIGGHYRVLGLLGAGGMADVYEVEHVGLGRHFALKLLRSELARDTSLVQRFEREARAVAKLESAHIVAIVDSGIVYGAPYFVMERLYGEELRSLLLRSGALPFQRAVHIALDVCRALTVAHASGVIHRDLKPENLFITRSELGTDHCKVLDFGVAKLAGENPTMPGTLMGTARYMAPEQINHSTGPAPFTDIFSLAVILYECLTGRAPFAADTLERVLYRILTEPPTPLLELRPEIPPGLAELVHQALAKVGHDRPQSAAAFAEALAPFTGASRARTNAYPHGDDVTLVQTEGNDTLAAPLTSPAAHRPATARDKLTPQRRFSMLVAGATFGAGLCLGVWWGRVSSDRPESPAASPAKTTRIASAAVAEPEPITPHDGVALDRPPRVPEPKTLVARPFEARPRAQPSTLVPSAAAPPTTPPLFYPNETLGR
jgi:serine/threonine protein kinase